MIQIDKAEFMRNPAACLDAAIAGDYTTVRLDDGTAVVMIDECEWTIMRQALKLCMEHPEWTIKQK